MRKHFKFSIFVILLLVFLITGCQEGMSRPKTGKPSLELVFGSELMYSDRTQYMVLKQADIEVTAYYDLADREFVGIVKNTGRKVKKNIAIEFTLDDASEIVTSKSFDLESDSVEKINAIPATHLFKFKYWTARIIFDEMYKLSKKESKVEIYTYPLLKDGVYVNLEMDLMKYYDWYDVEKDEGVKFKNKIYAGRHQSYYLKKGPLEINAEYNYLARAVMGTVTRVKSDHLTDYYIKLYYDEDKEPLTVNPGLLKTNATEEFAFKSMDWEEFEIYRIELYYYMPYGQEQPPKQIEIKDIF